MRAVVVGSTVVDDLTFVDGTENFGILGGCGIYSAVAMRLFDDDVFYISDAGEDFPELFGELFSRNGLSTEGVRIHPGKKTSCTNLRYREDGRWEMVPRYLGTPFFMTSRPDWQSNQVMQQAVSQCDALMLYASAKGWVWDFLRELRGERRFFLCWEPHPADVVAEKRDLVVQNALLCDLFSINWPESRDTFGFETKEEAIAFYKVFPVPVLFRCGAEGAYLIKDGESYFGPSIEVDAVDPTGCGNTCSSAVCYALAAGWDSQRAIVAGSVAAGHNAKQYGPIPQVTEALRAEILREIDTKTKQIMENGL